MLILLGALAGLAVTAGLVAIPAGAGRRGTSAGTPGGARRGRQVPHHSFEQAQRDGHTVAGEPRIVSPAGKMGIHAVNPALLADDAIDPLRPEILLYAPKDNGQLKLVGVEYWKRDADQNLATAGDEPSLFGRGQDGPIPGHNPTMPIHYDLHVWVAEANPSGVFALFNPALSC